MENSIEKGLERIPTKEEVVEFVSRFAEKLAFEGELYDEKGLYFLEVRVEDKKPGDTTLYMYMRKGEHPNHNEALETAIHSIYYQGEVAVGGEKLAVYKSETEEWEEVR